MLKPLIATLLATTLALAGCTSTTSPSPTSWAPTGDASARASASAPADPSASASADPSASGSADPSASASATTPSASPDRLQPVKNPNPLPKAAKPGTAVAMGKPVIVEQKVRSTGAKADDGSILWELAVSGFEPGDPAVLEKLSDKREFAGGTVWNVMATAKVVALNGSAAKEDQRKLLTPGVTLLDDQGDGAGGIISFGSSTQGGCETLRLEYVNVGDSVDGCSIALVKKGHKPVAGAYAGPVSMVGLSTDPYAASPVIWKK